MNKHRHNTAFRKIRSALKLTADDVVAITYIGGIDISKSKANGWGRNPNTQRKPDIGSRNPSNLERRGKSIGDDEWDAFWEGLDIWLHNNN